MTRTSAAQLRYEVETFTTPSARIAYLTEELLGCRSELRRHQYSAKCLAQALLCAVPSFVAPSGYAEACREKQPEKYWEKFMESLDACLDSEAS